MLIKRNNRGFTLIEAILALAIGAIILVSLTKFFASNSKNDSIKSTAGDIGNVLTAVARRLHHDGFDFSLFDENGGNAGINDNLTWDKDSFRSDFIKKYLIAHEANCGLVDGWNPKNSDGTLDGGDETVMDKTTLVSCGMFESRVPYNLEFSSVLSLDGTTNKVDKFKMYINFSNSTLFKDKNIQDIHRLRDGIENYLKSKQMLKGIPFVGYGRMGDLNDPYDDFTMSDMTCGKEKALNRECTLIVGLDFTGTTNNEYLQVDGGNSMLASVKFAGSNTVPQKCIWWQNPDKSAAEQGDNTGGIDVSVWTAREVMCGISGGNDSPVVEAVVNNVQTNGLTITNPLDLNHMCKVYQMGFNGDFIDPASNVNDGSGSTIPCGIINKNNVIVLAVENAFIGQAAIKDLVVQNAYANTLRIKHNPAYDDEIETGDKGVDAITGIMEMNNHVLLEISDSSSQAQFRVQQDGYTWISGPVEITENLSVDKGAYINESLQVGMSNNSRVQFGNTNSLNFYNHNPNEFTVSASENLSLVAGNMANKDIRITADKVVNSGEYYTTKGHFSSYYGDPYNIDSALNANDYKLVSMDYVKHLENLVGKVQTRATIPVGAGSSNIVSKPDCFDFVRANPQTYGTKAIYAEALNDKGFDYARILITPIYNKTYSAALGDNQVYSQHAVHNNAFTWEVYFYLAGEGITGTGGREDDVGSGIATLICDFNGIDFNL